MRLYLFRHAETQHNIGGITLGRTDVPLTERGGEQARSIVGIGGTHVLDGPSISAVYSSPLIRAMETARPVAASLKLQVQEEPRLIEMDVGEMEGLTFGALRERFPEFLKLWLSEGLAEARMPGGETLAEVQERAWQSIDELEQRHEGSGVAVFTHNFVILALLCRLLNLPLSKFRVLRQDLAAVSAIDFSAGSARVVVLNDRCHLAPAPRS